MEITGNGIITRIRKPIAVGAILASASLTSAVAFAQPAEAAPKDKTHNVHHTDSAHKTKSGHKKVHGGTTNTASTGAVPVNNPSSYETSPQLMKRVHNV